MTPTVAADDAQNRSIRIDCDDRVPAKLFAHAAQIVDPCACAKLWRLPRIHRLHWLVALRPALVERHGESAKRVHSIAPPEKVE
ncbi:MAG: hypothetical protein NVSMB1_03240 [Polyangiales bacterium]